MNHDLISAEAEAEQTDVSLRVKRPTILLRRESVRNVWGHDIADGLDWTAALSREYWASVIEKFRPGDHVDIHSFDHRIQFTMLVLDTNTSTDPIYFDIAFLPVYPADLRLPVLPPQREPRYQVRQAPGMGASFNVIDTSTGRPAHENPKYRARRSAVSAVIDRFFKTISLIRRGATPTASARRFWLRFIGLRNSSKRTSPG